MPRGAIANWDVGAPRGANVPLGQKKKEKKNATAGLGNTIPPRVESMYAAWNSRLAGESVLRLSYFLGGGVGS